MSSSKLHHALGIHSSNDLSPNALASAILLSFQELNISPEDFPEIAPQIASLSTHIEQAHFAQAQLAEQDVEAVETNYASRNKEYEELDTQIKSSGEILGQLSDFLAQFQNDLSSVSSSIAELQARSKLIENRLEGRRLLEANLTPYITNTIIPPALISTIMTTEPGQDWLEAINTLELRLIALRTSSLETRPPESSNQVADKLRLVAANKIRGFFVAAFAPFRTSITTNLQITQSSFLLKYRSLFAFLQRHSARIAHEVQKAYVGTARWYFETGLRRYVRALEKIKARGWPKLGLVGSPQPASIPLDGSVISHSQLDGADVVLAYMAEASSFKQSPEALFRSLALVVADNAASEYNFVSHFFGQPPPTTRSSASPSSLFPISPNESSPSLSTNGRSMVRKGSVISSVADSESYVTGTGSELMSLSGRSGERKAHTAIDLVWKQIIEPVFEYQKTFTAKLVSMNDLPDTNSIYAMIQLNDALIESIGSSCPSFESHLMAIKMQLWPMFQIKMNSETECMGQLSLRRDLREAGLRAACRKYVWLFSTVVGMEAGRGGEETKVASDLLRLREALVAAVQAHATKTHGGADSKKAYLHSIYQEIQQGLMAGPSNQVCSQAEAAYWRELVRRTR